MLPFFVRKREMYVCVSIYVCSMCLCMCVYLSVENRGMHNEVRTGW